MPISIKREEALRLARALKLRTRRLAEMRAISRRVARLPNRDTRSADEIVGYDENGLPS